MNPIFLRATISSLALAVLVGGPVSAASTSDRDTVVAAIKANVRDIVTGINTRNADLATTHDAPNIVTIQTNQANTVGAAADN